MWTRHSKVDLTSDNFKTKKVPQRPTTPKSKSPLNKSKVLEPHASAQKIDPYNIFQKVCCPNCRYIFKTIKNNQIFNSSPERKIPTVSEVSVQTDRSPTKTPRDLFLDSRGLIKLQSPNKSSSSIFKTSMIRHNNLNTNESKQEPDHLKSSTYQFPERSPIKHKSIRKLNQSNTQNRAEQLLRETSKTSTVVIEKQRKNQKNENHQPQKDIVERLMRYERGQIRKDLSELPALLSSELKNTKTVDHLACFYTDLPASVQIPSYFKMLITDYNQPSSKPSSYNLY